MAIIDPAAHPGPHDAPPARARRRLGPVSRTLLWGMRTLFRRGGWRAERTEPTPRRCVIIAAPHTSNWDFPYTMGLLDELQLDVHFMAKQSLFRWPMGGFMRAMGGIPVIRDSGRNYVQAMIDEFAQREEFKLIVAPEGTRGNAQQWRTGFYHIALGAKVPIVLGMLDYRRKAGGLGPAIMPTGDYAADMAMLQTYYSAVTPRYPERATASIVAASALPGGTDADAAAR